MFGDNWRKEDEWNSISSSTTQNYDNWCIHIRALLGGYDVWEPVAQGVVAEDVNAAAVKKDQKPLPLICLSIDEKMFDTVTNATTSKEALDILQASFSGVSKH